MKTFVFIAALVATFLIGYTVRLFQDRKRMRWIRKTDNDILQRVKFKYEERERMYETQINRLNAIIAKNAAQRIEDKKRAKLTDFVEAALTKDNYQEVTFRRSD